MNNLPLVTVGIQGPTVLKLLLLIALQPDNGGEGCGGLATLPPASVSLLYFYVGIVLPSREPLRRILYDVIWHINIQTH